MVVGGILIIDSEGLQCKLEQIYAVNETNSWNALQNRKFSVSSWQYTMVHKTSTLFSIITSLFHFQGRYGKVSTVNGEDCLLIVCHMLHKFIMLLTVKIYYPRQLCQSAWIGCLPPSVCLSVCPQHNSKTNDPKVYKLSTLWCPRNDMVLGFKRSSSRLESQQVHFSYWCVENNSKNKWSQSFQTWYNCREWLQEIAYEWHGFRVSTVRTLGVRSSYY